MTQAEGIRDRSGPLHFPPSVDIANGTTREFWDFRVSRRCNGIAFSVWTSAALTLTVYRVSGTTEELVATQAIAASATGETAFSIARAIEPGTYRAKLQNASGGAANGTRLHVALDLSSSA